MSAESLDSGTTRWSQELLPSILIIEDDPAHVEAIARSLEPLTKHYRVRVARSLREGKLAVTAERPALVLADLHLSDGHALDMLSCSRNGEGFPMLVMTSQGDERTAVQSIRAGALDYVVKSVDSLAELPRTVERALREWRLSEDRQRAERELRESEERFRVLFGSAPDALLIYEPDGRVLDANKAAERLFGMPRHQLLSSRVDALGFEADGLAPHMFRRALQRADQSADPLLLHMVSATGERREVELRTVALKLSGQSVVLATVQDVSARVHAEHTRRRLEEQLHHALKLDALGRLAGGVAHDFNNLLTAIAGYAELMLRGGASVSEYPSALQEILNAAQRAGALTAQLLAFSRKQVIEPVVLDLNGLLENATRMIQRLIGEDVTLVFAPGAALYPVKVDPNQIEQVLFNLAVNARDAMPGGGSLTVRTQNIRVFDKEAQDHIEIVPGEYVLLEVEDTGTGMNEETQARLFEPFYTTKDRGQGTGLGLSIIYGVIKQNGGFITVKSRLGVGTRFSIYLPQTEHDASEPSASQDVPAPTVGDETILVVEDEAAVRDVVTRFLVNAGYHVIAVSEAAEAIALLENDERSIDLLLTDVVLPSMDGKQLHQRLSALRPGLRVLFVSGYTNDVIERHGLVDSSIPLLEKPLTQAALLRAVRAALDVSS